MATALLDAGSGSIAVRWVSPPALASCGTSCHGLMEASLVEDVASDEEAGAVARARNSQPVLEDVTADEVSTLMTRTTGSPMEGSARSSEIGVSAAEHAATVQMMETASINGSSGADATVLVEDSGVGRVQEAGLRLVSLNPKSAANFDIAAGSFSVVSVLPDPSSDIRTVRISCGRDAANTIVLRDGRISLHHFTLNVSASRAGYVAVNLRDESSNGTLINGKRPSRDQVVPLAVGDQISVLLASQVGRASEVGYALVHDTRAVRSLAGQRGVVGCGATASVASNATRGSNTEGVGASAAPGRPASARPVMEDSCRRSLEADLRCGICRDALHRCLTLVPCGHNFCSACLARWRRASAACPECRASVQQAVRNKTVDCVVDTFLKAHPEAGRTHGELVAMEVAERDPQNGAMLRWLLREGRNSDVWAVPTPMRWQNGNRGPDSARRASGGAPPTTVGRGGAGVDQNRHPSSSACAIS